MDGILETGAGAEIHVDTPVTSVLDENVAVAFAPAPQPVPIVVADTVLKKVDE